MRIAGSLALFFVAVVVSCSSLLACSSGDSSGADPKACVAHTNPPAAELASPVTSFETDVAPILARSCAFSSCHASQRSGNHGVFLAAKSSEDMKAVKASLVRASVAMPSMPYVTPGDPDKSFLLHKLDGDLCAFEESCVGGSCGSSMPQGNAILPEASRDAVRRWIAQGAK
jgi:hypothetical protein